MAAGLKAGVKVPSRMGQSGAIAWHGSPHKFDKFSLDKIGTGEGAQAYGHGLYLAESPEVAKSYKVGLSSKYPVSHSGVIEENGQFLAWAKPADGSDVKVLHTSATKKEAQEALRKYMADKRGAIYKTDIPDEAVARFLDWDKPLSQQAPEVQAALKKVTDSTHGKGTWDQWIKGGHDYRDFRNDLMEIPESDISQLLHKQGIPGIRYLDGGSRSNGAGTSNFVAFDPELIRILERNGIPTGNQPWKPGEWQGMLSGTK